jgi:5-methylthioadenosine/S-adenosylhomocysteine deaminase
MFNEMKITSLMHKYKNRDATMYPAWKVLRMATIEAARALQMDDKVGSLKNGKLADIIIVDLERLTMSPIFDDPIRNIIPNLVYSARGDEVETVIIDGKVVVENHKILTINEEEVIIQANQAAKRISNELKQSKWKDVMPLVTFTSQKKY